MGKSLFLLTFSLILISCNQSKLNRRFRTQGDFHFDHIPTRWDEALPLGNGMLGELVWQKGDTLRFSLDRADLWDLRPVKELKGMTYQWVQQHVNSGNYQPVHRLGDQPYDQKPYPTKIPAAALNFNISGFGDIEYANLYLKSAEAEIKWKKGITLQTFVHATEPVGWFRFEHVPDGFSPIMDEPEYSTVDSMQTGNEVTGGHGLNQLGYPQGPIERGDHFMVYTQQGWGGMSYQVAVKWKNEGNICTGVWSISSQYPEDEREKNAGKVVENALRSGLPSYQASHIKWWQRFWGKSSVSVPDTLLQKEWERDMYKFGSVARQGAPAITLQAVWTADNGSLPPWKGDFHHDLNTELSYWPGYSGNHLDLTQSFTDWLWKIRDENKKYTRSYFKADGLNVPGVTTLTGQPMGGWIQYSMSPTISAWLAQHFYWQWKYSMDTSFLKERAYPYIHEVAVYLEDISELKNGKRVLPLSSSPEINDNKIDAWFSKTTNYDLSLMKFAFKAAAEVAGSLDKKEEQNHWKSCLSELPDLSIDEETGLNVAPGYPLNVSHRHFSHLMSIYPLGLLDPANGKTDRRVMDRSLKHLEKLGTRNWCGYSFSWAAGLYARAGDGEKAANMLRIFTTNFISPNSFHLNGDQKGGEYSDLTYRPFTLEGNFAFASGLQEMLMQSNTDTLEIFPAIPRQWQNISFENLRARGAFLVSADKKDGKLKTVTIKSEKGTMLHLKYPGSRKNVNVTARSIGREKSHQLHPEWQNNILSISTEPGQIITVERP